MLFMVLNANSAKPLHFLEHQKMLLLQIQRDSAVPDSNVFIVQTAFNFLAVIEARERERACKAI